MVNLLAAVVSVVSVLIALGSFVFALRQAKSGRSEALLGRVSTLERHQDKLDTLLKITEQLQSESRSAGERLTALETKIDVFWRSVAFDAARILHSPTTPTRDRLLEALQERSLTEDERAELLNELDSVLSAVEGHDGLPARRMAAGFIRVWIQETGTGQLD